MTDYSNIDDIGDVLVSKLHSYANEVLKYMNKETSKAVIDAYKEYGVWEREKIKELFKFAVQKFYDAYSPSFYSRTEGLFNVLDIIEDSYGMADYDSTSDLYNKDKLHGDRKGGSLFEKVFMQGWHGGAERSDKGGTPWYRGPVDFWNHWSREAVRTESPNNIFDRELAVARYGEMHDKLNSLAHKHNDKAMERVHNALPSIKSRVYG